MRSALRNWCDAFSRSAILGNKIEKFGIVRMRSKSVSESKFGPKDGAWYYSDEFFEARESCPDTEIKISALDPIFQLTFPDGSQKTVNPLNCYWLSLRPLRRVITKGGYILDKTMSELYSNSFLKAENGEEPRLCDNSTFIRYPRDKNFLQKNKFPIDPPIGSEVIALYLLNYKDENAYRVFTLDRKAFPFEVAPDLISYELWNRPLPKRDNLFFDQCLVRM